MKEQADTSTNSNTNPDDQERALGKIRRRLIKLFSLWLLIPVISVSSQVSPSLPETSKAYLLTGFVSLAVFLISAVFIWFYRHLFHMLWSDTAIRIRLIVLILSVPFLSVPLDIKVSGMSNVPVFVYLVFWSSLGYSILFSDKATSLLKTYLQRQPGNAEKDRSADRDHQGNAGQ